MPSLSEIGVKLSVDAAQGNADAKQHGETLVASAKAGEVAFANTQRSLTAYETELRQMASQAKVTGSALSSMVGSPGRLAALQKEIDLIKRMPANPWAVGGGTDVAKQTADLARLTAAVKVEEAEVARSARMQQHWADTAKASANAAKVLTGETPVVVKEFGRIGTAAVKSNAEIMAMNEALKANYRAAVAMASAPKTVVAKTPFPSPYAPAPQLRGIYDLPSAPSTMLDKAAVAKLYEHNKALDANAAAARKAAGEQKGLASANEKTTSTFSSLTPTIISNYIAYLALQKSLNAISAEFTRGFDAVENYKLSVAEGAAFITTYSEKLAQGDLGGAFQEAYAYSEQLVLSLEKMDARTIATGEDLKIINQAFIRNRVLLNDQNQEQVQGFLNTANALKMLFPLQKDQMQMNQEIGAVMAGQVRAGDKLAMVLKAQDPLIQENIEQWKREGTVYENLGRLLAGFAPAVDKLHGSWTEVSSTLDTIHNAILRDGFKPVMADILGIANELRDSLIDSQGELTANAVDLQEKIKLAYEVTNDLGEAIAYAGTAWVTAKVATWGASFLLAAEGASAVDKAIKAGTYSQLAFNAAAAVNPWIILGTTAVGTFVMMKEHLEKLTEEMLAAEEGVAAFGEKWSMIAPPEGLADNRKEIDALLVQRKKLEEQGNYWEKVFGFNDKTKSDIKAIDEQIMSLLNGINQVQGWSLEEALSPPVQKPFRMKGVPENSFNMITYPHPPELSQTGLSEKELKERTKALDAYDKAMADTLEKEAAEVARVTEKYQENREAIFDKYKGQKTTAAEISDLNAQDASEQKELAEIHKKYADQRQADMDKEYKKGEDILKKKIEGLKKWEELQRQANEKVAADREKAQALTDDIFSSTIMGEQAAAIYKVEQAYDALESKLIELVEITGMSAEKASAWQTELRENADAQIVEIRRAKDEHKETADEVDKLWQHTYERMGDYLADAIATGKADLDSFGDSFERMAAQMLSTWIMTTGKMVFSGEQMSASQQASLAGSGAMSGIMAPSMASSNSGLGATMALYSAYNELQNPGAYGQYVANLQSASAKGLQYVGAGTVGFGTGATVGAAGAGTGSFAAAGSAGGATPLWGAAASKGSGAAGYVSNMSSSTAGAWSAGIGTFVLDLIQGKEFKQAAAEGVGAAAGAKAGATIGSYYWPGVGTAVGAIVGSFLGALGAGSLFGGKKDPPRTDTSGFAEFTDSSWDRYRGFAPTDMLTLPAPGGDDWDKPVREAYIGGYNQVIQNFNESTLKLRETMSDAAWDAFAASLEKTEFADVGLGVSKVKNVGGAITRGLEGFALNLQKAFNVAAIEALGADYLTGDTVALLKEQISAGSDLTQYFQDLYQIIGAIDKDVADSKLSAYELGIREINSQFDGYAIQLKAMGIDLEKYTALEEARAIALEKQALTLEMIENGDVSETLKGLAEGFSSVSEAGKRYGKAIATFDAFEAKGYVPEAVTMEVADSQSEYWKAWNDYLAAAPENLQTLTDVLNGLSPAADAAVTKIGNLADVFGYATDIAENSLVYAESDNASQGAKDKAAALHAQAIALADESGAALAAGIDKFFAPMQEVIDERQQGPLQQGFANIQKQYDQWLALGQELETELGDLFDYDLWMSKAGEAAELLGQELVDNFVDPVSQAIKHQVDALQFSDLAPVQSEALYNEQYQKLLAGAMSGDQQGVNDFLSFTNDYLGFQKDFGGDYQGTFDAVLADIKSIKQEPVKVELNADGVKQAVIDGFVAVLSQMEGPDGQPIQIMVNETVLGEVVVKGILYSPNVKTALSDAGYGQFSPQG